MSSSTNGRTVKKLFFVGLFALPLLSGCNSGDTDGGSANDNAGQGIIPVSNGGFGATLTIELDDGTNEIAVGDKKGFHVTALDPLGQPLTRRRVFCESEKGIAIIEPSSGGVAFEHTNLEGKLSGVLGGAQPGSYLLECRLEEGFNLVARKSFKITGEVPIGFAGFPGAAGGNLGGGTLADNPNQAEISADQVLYSTLSSGGFVSAAKIDLGKNLLCRAPNGTATAAEPFGPDDYQVTFTNPTPFAADVTEIEFTVQDGRSGVTSVQSVGLTVKSGSTAQIIGHFTEPSGSASNPGAEVLLGLKEFAGTTFRPLAGSYEVDFTVKGTTEDGEDFSVDVPSFVQFSDFNNCASGG